MQPTTFASRLKEIRLEHDMTVQDLADQLLVDRGTIYSWESDKTFPTLLLAEDIADLYSVSLDWLTGRTDKR